MHSTEVVIPHSPVSECTQKGVGLIGVFGQVLLLNVGTMWVWILLRVPSSG